MVPGFSVSRSTPAAIIKDPVRRMKLFSADHTNSVTAYDTAPSVEEDSCKEHAAEMVQKVVMKLSPKLRTCSYFEIHRRPIVFANCRAVGLFDRHSKFPPEPES